MAEKITSLCIGICSMDDETGYCRGCFRTMEEISNWIFYTEKERLSIINELENRADNLTNPLSSQPSGA